MKTETIIPEELTTEPNNLWDSFQTSYQANWTPSQRTKPLQLQIQFLWFFFPPIFLAVSFLRNILIPPSFLCSDWMWWIGCNCPEDKASHCSNVSYDNFRLQICWTKYIWNAIELFLVKIVFNNSKPVIQLL